METNIMQTNQNCISPPSNLQQHSLTMQIECVLKTPSDDFLRTLENQIRLSNPTSLVTTQVKRLASGSRAFLFCLRIQTIGAQEDWWNTLRCLDEWWNVGLIKPIQVRTDWDHPLLELALGPLLTKELLKPWQISGDKWVDSRYETD